MKKTTKGALAAVAGGSLLFGGAGSLAYWTDNSTVGGANIKSGTLTMSTPICDGTDTDGVTHEWQFDDDTPFNPASDQVVPEDSLSRLCELTLHMEGKHIAATLAVTGGGFPADVANQDLIDDLDLAVTYTVNGAAYDPTSGPLVINKPGDSVVKAQIDVDFDSASGNESRALVAALDNIVLTATQSHDLTAN